MVGRARTSWASQFKEAMHSRIRTGQGRVTQVCTLDQSGPNNDQVQTRTDDDLARPSRARARPGQGPTRTRQNQGKPDQANAHRSHQPQSEPAWARIRQPGQSQDQARARHSCRPSASPGQSGPAMVSQDQPRPSGIMVFVVLPKPEQGAWDGLGIMTGGLGSGPDGGQAS